jgi:hypothetical protein
MHISSLFAGLALAAAITPAVFGQAPVRYFRPIASFAVATGNAEIVAASADGRTLAYSDATAGRLGLVNIADPARPIALPDILTGGEPTSVAFAGRYLIGVVITTPSTVGQPAPDPLLPTNAGRMFVIDMANPAAPVNLGSIAIGFQPDSVKATWRDGRIVAVVCIENQPIVVDSAGRVLADDRPGFPVSGTTFPQDRSLPGLVQVLTIDPANLAQATVADVALPTARLTEAGLLFPQDPQPEFVDLYGSDRRGDAAGEQRHRDHRPRNPRAPRLQRVFSTGSAVERTRRSARRRHDRVRRRLPEFDRRRDPGADAMARATRCSVARCSPTPSRSARRLA